MNEGSSGGCSDKASGTIDKLRTQALARCRDRIDEALKRPKGRKPKPCNPSYGITSVLRNQHGL
ncbi:MAG: hypothetical protein XE11_1568 [Methanomicrobiales archaeon 53_19]|jgi:hypothetical protein|uniref:hypothetical protein n=1 Tax=Methanocalculus sp. TaxID=2004547 RepID=UPI000749A021|nr:hypothetical protein [Methanocalculus sp.]KUK69474.1 MAG: hypothetical protein XD88_1260 [Methanocalculus sp. 52_23]KUL02898.1 MAG: hypothetical protein XE11_1568 [Methanomicrobiales archaeon 53_19]HIJ06461.1 hypothetical protein [Methanocalculus sp.]